MNHLTTVASAAAADAPIGSLQILTLSVAGELYAIGIRDVKEIIEYGGVTRVPMVGRKIRGVLNLRGRIIPVIDLAERLGLKGGGVGGRRSCVVVVTVLDGAEQTDLGIAVDAVSQVLTVEAADLQKAPSFGTRIRDDFIESMVRIADRFAVILDQSKVLSVDELAAAAGS